MQVALEVFRANVRRSRDLIAIFRAMRIQTTQVLDLTEVLRAALVNTVSSFDLFVHELVRIGMLESYSSERAKTKAFLRFQVTLLGVLEAISNTGSSSWLEQEIRGRLGHQSFQLPDNVADAIRLISEVELWNEMSAMLGGVVKSAVIPARVGIRINLGPTTTLLVGILDSRLRGNDGNRE